MITKQDFELINKEVVSSLEEALNFLRVNCLEHNYILYLADGEYVERFKRSRLKLSPYTIDNREDGYKDESRLNFFIQFMQIFYSFPTGINATDDNEYKLTMELMIYTHVWESKPFLKQLFRLAELANGKSYDWNVQVPELSKHQFIRKQIRDTLKKKRLHLANIISNGFHTSLRNAFAHSEYRLNDKYKFIHLDTYKGETWDIEKISFDDWSKRFAYTALLSYHFLNLRAQKRKALPNDFGKTEFFITLPINERKFKVRTIYYDEHWDKFSFSK